MTKACEQSSFPIGFADNRLFVIWWLFLSRQVPAVGLRLWDYSWTQSAAIRTARSAHSACRLSSVRMLLLLALCLAQVLPRPRILSLPFRSSFSKFELSKRRMDESWALDGCMQCKGSPGCRLSVSLSVTALHCTAHPDLDLDWDLAYSSCLPAYLPACCSRCCCWADLFFGLPLSASLCSPSSSSCLSLSLSLFRYTGRCDSWVSLLDSRRPLTPSSSSPSTSILSLDLILSLLCLADVDLFSSHHHHHLVVLSSAPSPQPRFDHR